MTGDFFKSCASTPLLPICPQLLACSNQAFTVNNGNISRWEAAINVLKTQGQGDLNFTSPYLHIDVKNSDKNILTKELKQFMPWRKGPYQIGDLQLDSEWRGDMKWNRLTPHISALKNRVVLDVGAGNGYFTYLMALNGANVALGIDPFLLFNYQFHALRSLINHPPNAFILPLQLTQVPSQPLFDTVFSMGVLYHQKDPMTHLQQLKALMTSNGEMVLETLIIDKKYGAQIIPKDRYARMRNVWCLPSIDTLTLWLQKTGFNKIRLVDITKTTAKEQHVTHWMGDNTQSLQDFLNPNDDNFTIEGLPAPQRAIFICSK